MKMSQTADNTIVVPPEFESTRHIMTYLDVNRSSFNLNGADCPIRRSAFGRPCVRNYSIKEARLATLDEKSVTSTAGQGDTSALHALQEGAILSCPLSQLS